MILREAIAKWFYGPEAKKEWPTLDDEDKEEYHDAADALIHLLREQGLVQLDKDQSLPENPVEIPFISGYGYDHTQYNKYEAAQQKVLKAGFRKVHELGEL